MEAIAHLAKQEGAMVFLVWVLVMALWQVEVHPVLAVAVLVSRTLPQVRLVLGHVPWQEPACLLPRHVALQRPAGLPTTPGEAGQPP